MKLSSLLQPYWIVLDLQSETLEESISELLSKAERLHTTVAEEELAEAVLRRESQSTTALAGGVAIPHARVSHFEEFLICLGRTAKPMRTEGMDGQPVDLVFLIIASDRKNTLMLQSMAAVSKLCQEEGNVERIRKAANRDEAWRAIDESGVNVKKTLYASDVMSDAFVRAEQDMPLRDLLDRMFESGRGIAVVLDDNDRVKGSVTAAEILDGGFPDYMQRLRDVSFLSDFEPFEQFFKREAETKVEQIMNREPVAVAHDDPMIQVIFRLRQDRALFAVVEREGRLVGIIHRDSIINRILRA